MTSGDKSASLQVYETFQVPGSKFQVSMLEGHAASMAGGCLCGADDRVGGLSQTALQRASWNLTG